MPRAGVGVLRTTITGVMGVVDAMGAVQMCWFLSLSFGCHDCSATGGNTGCGVSQWSTKVEGVFEPSSISLVTVPCAAGPHEV